VARKSAPDEQGYKVKERGVQFNVPKDRDRRGGNNYLSLLLSKSSCDCDDADIDMTYRMCCISVGNSPLYTAVTLFDTGAHASFVNREVASWIEEHGGTDRQMLGQKRGWQEASSTTVPLAGTSMSSPILGSVVFDLNEVSRRHETITDIHAQVINSCIAVIISRPLIRANHLVQKLLFYFDETPRSKPDLNQPVVPVTTLATTRARCRGTQTCGTGLQRHLMLVVSAEG
jgi:hypothetical protein